MLTIDSKYTVILANGTFPTSPVPLLILNNASRIICCDGAAVSLMEYGLQPTAVVGDLDSISPEIKSALAGKIIHYTEQETNDLNKAFRYCLSHSWHDIVILGATGKREDHTLGNISLLADFAEQLPGIQMVTDDGCFFVMRHSSKCECHPGQQISIFAMDANTPITSTGLRYPLKGLVPTRWWQATLNEASGESFSLSFPEGHSLILFLAN